MTLLLIFPSLSSFAHVWDMDAKVVQQQLWSCLSTAEFLYVGPSSLLNTTLLSNALAALPLVPAHPAPPLDPRSGPYRVASVSAPTSPFSRVQPIVVVRIPRNSDLHPILLQRLLRLNMFYWLRSKKGFCYAVDVDFEMELDSFVVTITWIAGNDFPAAGGDANVLESVATALSAISSPIEERLWDAVMQGLSVRMARGISSEVLLQQAQLALWNQSVVFSKESRDLEVKLWKIWFPHFFFLFAGFRSSSASACDCDLARRRLHDRRYCSIFQYPLRFCSLQMNKDCRLSCPKASEETLFSSFK